MYAAATEASSTHTSVTVTSPMTTTANAQPLRKELPIFRQAASRSSISRSSTATNCHECAFFDVGATSAAFSNSCTWSGAIGSAVNFRELRRRIINSLKLSIVLSINWCSYSRIQSTSPIPRVYPVKLRQIHRAYPANFAKYTVCTRSNFAGGRSRLDLLLLPFLPSREEKGVGQALAGYPFYFSFFAFPTIISSSFGDIFTRCTPASSV